jgi:hypothetical protein
LHGLAATDDSEDVERCRLLSAESDLHAHSREAHSGCRLQGRGASMSIDVYQRRRYTGPKVQRHDGAEVGPARSGPWSIQVMARPIVSL